MQGFRQRSPLQPDQNSFWTRTRHVQTKMDCLQQKTSCLFKESLQFSKASSPNKKLVMREPSRCCSCTSGSAAGSIASLVQHVVGAARIGTTVASHSIKRILSVTPTPKHTHHHECCRLNSCQLDLFAVYDAAGIARIPPGPVHRILVHAPTHTD